MERVEFYRRRQSVMPTRCIVRIGGVVCLMALWGGVPFVRADTLTAGPDGMHATVQAAVDEATGRGADLFKTAGDQSPDCAGRLVSTSITV